MREWLTIEVINCDDKYITYQWDLIEDFVSDMESDKFEIPMLDDVLASVDTDIETLLTWWRNSDDAFSVDNLLDKCKEIVKKG